MFKEGDAFAKAFVTSFFLTTLQESDDVQYVHVKVVMRPLSWSHYGHIQMSILNFHSLFDEFN